MIFRLLSCDGGGIRGYISSKLIQALDQHTDGKLLQNVDGFAGTSTGGLISIALASGVSIDQVVSFYQNDANKIFTENWDPRCYFPRDKDKAALAQAVEQQGIFSGPGFFSCQYTSEGLKAIMSHYLGKKTFADISDKKMLAVNSAQLDDSATSPANWAPATLNNKGVGRDYSTVTLLDAALATSAAPTYFPPHQIGKLGYFVDGGTYANDPVLNGIVVALKSRLAESLADIQVVSMGTGFTGENISPSAVDNPLCWGAANWLWPPKSSAGVPAMALLNLTLSLSARNAGRAMHQLLQGNLVRIDPTLSSSVPLDGYSPKDYRIMDQAIAAAQKLPEWSDAVSMVNTW